MATVRDYMDGDPVTVSPDASLEEVARVLGEGELPGVSVVNGDGRVVGIVSENDLATGGGEGHLHVPPYVKLFGGLLFLAPSRRFEARVRKALASSAEDMMT